MELHTVTINNNNNSEYNILVRTPDGTTLPAKFWQRFEDNIKFERGPEIRPE
jgi:hypothetical protein